MIRNWKSRAQIVKIMTIDAGSKEVVNQSLLGAYIRNQPISCLYQSFCKVITNPVITIRCTPVTTISSLLRFDPMESIMLVLV